MKKSKVAFIGSGLIGSGLAANALLHGYPAALQTRSRVETMKTRVNHIFDVFVGNSVCTRDEADEARKLASYTTSIEEAVTGASFIQESGPEDLDTKRGLYERIEACADENAVISSSTSAMLPTDLQANAARPERILVGHPYHPSYLLPLVEVCGGRHTSRDTVEKARVFYESIGKVVIVCEKEVSGYIVNRVSWAAFEEARKTVADGVCSVGDIDRALMYGPGLRMALTGQILTISLGIEGGIRGAAAKYGREPSPEDEMVARGVDEEIAARPVLIGNTEESVADFRDKAIIGVLRMQGLL
jgi:carnitine 3-dehydrogenase